MNKEKKEQRETNRLLVVAVLLLLLIAGLLLWLLLRPQELIKVPTGNVDIFDIKIGCRCGGDDENCDKDEDGDGVSDENTPGENGYKNYSKGTINGHTSENKDDGIVYVDDNNGLYVFQKNLKIFENPAFAYTNKVAPGVSNSYDFKVHNETNNAIRYNIDFLEESEYTVNMQYRLRRGNNYVIGSENNWVSGKDLKMTTLKQLASDGVDGYTLDWKWPYEDGKDAQDTEAGEKMASEYVLSIKVNFKEV